VLHTPLSLAFLSDDSKTAYDMALALCSSGASFNEDDRLTVLGRIESASGDSKNAQSETALWRSGLRACVDVWILEHSVGVASLTTVPIEVVNRGEASVKTYLADVAQSAYDDRLHRCKICVVGPSEWGKTSLVHSLKSNETFLTEKKDRTVGIDLTTWVSKSIVDDAAIRLEITFWDFAGQDVYQAAHTLFFSARTLFVLVVDLEAYWNELQDAERKSDRVSEAQMNRFVGTKIFRWVRSIFAHQPDAQFVVAGTKVNRLQDARVVAEIWDDLRDRLDHWKAAFAKGLDRELLPARASAKDIKALQAKLANLASSNWLVANIMDVDSIGDMRGAVQKTITTSDLGFPMWKTYTQVLQSVVTRREAARSAATARDRIEKSIIRFSNLRRQLLREVDTLDRDACEQILRTLNDLGDVLWYEHDGAGVFKDCIILDPMLVIEVVREVVRHDFSSHTDGKSPRDGRIPHTLLSTFPLWTDMDVELMHAFKALLQHFQLAYPADADVMLPESDIIVPAYWNADPPSPAPGAASKSSKSIASQKSVCDAFAVHHWCWEYEVPSELSETIFVQFAVQSHSAYLARTIRGFCVEAACAEFATSISLVQNDSSRDVLRIEVSGESADLSWHNMRFYLMKMEKVLESYGGDVIWRSIVYRPTGSSAESRHAVGPLVKAIEDAIVMGKGEHAVRMTLPWMPPDLDWFLRKAWNDITSFQQLQMNQLIEEKLEVLRKLAIAGDAPRQFPALWSLEYIPEAHKAMLRMSSDLSGRCYHVPIEIDTGSPLLARHASVFKVG
jgi:GTPase SAR1 family protein